MEHKDFRAIGNEKELQADLDRRRKALKTQQAREFEDHHKIIRRAQQLVEDPAELEPQSVHPTADELHAAERIINGNNEMVHTHFLERGTRASHSVARISRRDAAGNIRPEATGSLIGSRLLMTNHHVIGDKRSAARSVADFNYEFEIDGSERAYHRWTLDPDGFFATDEALDVTIVAALPPTDAPPDHEIVIGHNVLTDAEAALIVGEHVNVVQHPNGERKQVAFRENQLLDCGKDFLWYAADTLPGSSGSPVFNDQWVLVGLHRRSIPRQDGHTILNKDGTPHESSQSDDLIDWIANECVRASAIRRWLRDLELLDDQARLRDVLLTEGN